MATFTLQLRTDDALRAVRRLGDKAPTAIARALNRARVSAKTQIVRDMAKDTGLRQAAVRSQVVEREARPDKLTTSIETSGARISLKEFGARQTKRGVTANTGGGRKVYPGSFIVDKLGGHVFKRTGKARLPIQKLHGPSLPHVFEKYKPAAIARGEEQLVKNLEHEFRFAMQQAAQT